MIKALSYVPEDEAPIEGPCPWPSDLNIEEFCDLSDMAWLAQRRQEGRTYAAELLAQSEAAGLFLQASRALNQN